MQETTTEPIYILDHKRCIGIVTEISPSMITMILYSGGATNGHAPQDLPQPVSAGDFVLIAHGGRALVGKVSELKLSTPAENEEPMVLGRVQPLVSVDLEQGKLQQGILIQPQVGSKVYTAHPKLVQLLADLKPTATKNGRDTVFLSMGKLAGAETVSIDHTPESIFGRHCAILGTSGGGKSWTVARLLEESAKYNSKIVLFDATGEFQTLDEGTKHVHLGSFPDAPAHSSEVVIPYFHLTETDLFGIFKPSGQSQGPKLRAGMKSLKLAMREPELALDGVIIKINKSKQTYENAYRRHIAFIDRPNAEFDISSLSRQIENECVHPNRSSLEPQFWGDINGGDQAACMPLIGRIEDIIHSPHLSTIFFPERRPSLLKVIDSFMTDKEHSILRVSLQHLSFAHTAREIVSNAIGRHILMRAREGKFRERPLLLVIDEAHQFLNKTFEDETGKYSLDSFAQIAKEGRKYGLNICLATQRPRDIPEGVLSQVGTFIVHRLISDQDRTVVERASGEASAEIIGLLPVLAPGEAVLVGVDFPVALTIKMHKPKSEPLSEGPNYQRAWGTPS